jgi:hypothetical protein
VTLQPLPVFEQRSGLLALCLIGAIEIVIGTLSHG